jgi:hypothetical protein
MVLLCFAGGAPVTQTVYMHACMYAGMRTHAYIHLLQQVLKIHYLMALLCFVKAASVTLEALRFQAIKGTGEGAGWNTAYYVFAFAKVHTCNVYMFIYVFVCMFRCGHRRGRRLEHSFLRFSVRKGAYV